LIENIILTGMTYGDLEPSGVDDQLSRLIQDSLYSTLAYWFRALVGILGSFEKGWEQR
jgi:hypothetical protein